MKLSSGHILGKSPLLQKPGTFGQEPESHQGDSSTQRDGAMDSRRCIQNRRLIEGHGRLSHIAEVSLKWPIGNAENGSAIGNQSGKMKRLHVVLVIVSSRNSITERLKIETVSFASDDIVLIVAACALTRAASVNSDSVGRV
jgi:hypothetical protein